MGCRLFDASTRRRQSAMECRYGSPRKCLHDDDVAGIQVAGGEAQRALAHQAAFHDDLQGLTPFNEDCKEDSTVVAKRANTPRNHEFRNLEYFQKRIYSGHPSRPE